MQFGLFGGARTKRSAGIDDSQVYESFIEYVVEADRLGFRQLFMVEHHFTGHGQVSASMTLLAYLAAKTQKIRLGTAVVVLPWHNPILVAEQAATLDLLSGGRFDFGLSHVGEGFARSRVTVLGLVFVEPYRLAVVTQAPGQRVSLGRTLDQVGRAERCKGHG